MTLLIKWEPRQPVRFLFLPRKQPGISLFPA